MTQRASASASLVSSSVSRAGGDITASFFNRLSHTFKMRYLGIGFLWSWIYSLWFTPVVFPSAEGVTVNADLSWILSLSAVAVSLLVIPPLLRGKEAYSFRWARIAAPVVTTIGTFGMTASVLFGIDLSALSAIASVITGISSAWLWIAWGEFYARATPEVSELCAPTSVVVVIMCVFAISSMHGVIPIIIVSSFPIVSGILLMLAFLDDAVEPPAVLLPKAETKNFWPDFLRIAFGSAMVYAVIGFVWSAAATSSFVGKTPVPAYLLGATIAVIISVSSIFFSRRLNLFGLYRWMLPVLVSSLALLAVGTVWLRTISFTLIIIAQYGFDIIVWIYFSNVARKGYRPAAIAVGMGRGFIQVGDVLGSLLGIAAARWIAAGIITLNSLCLILICLVVTVVLFVLNQQEQFERAISEPDRIVVPEDSLSDICADLAERFSLSQREAEVLVFLAHGRSIPYIREALLLSKNTVETHAKHLYRKMGVHSRQELLDLVEQYRGGGM